MASCHQRLLVFFLAGAAICGPLQSLFTPRNPLGAGMAAWADDDDDGGDDDGNAGNPGSPTSNNEVRFSKNQTWKKQLVRKRKVKSQKIGTRNPRAKPIRTSNPPPSRAPRELVAYRLPDIDLAKLLSQGFTVLRKSALPNRSSYLLLRIPRNLSSAAALARLRKLSPTTKADFNHYYRNEYRAAAAKPCVTDACIPFNQVGWTRSKTACAAPLKIGIIDTSVNTKHPALKGLPLELINVADSVKTLPMDSHGTAVATLLFANEASAVPGLLPHLSVTAVNVFEEGQNSDLRSSAYAIARAIEELQSRGVRAINMSFAGPANDVLEASVKQAYENGIVMIAAVGNAGPGSRPLYPAGYAEVLAVTAVNDKEKPYRYAVRGNHIDVAAPGVGVLTVSFAGKQLSYTGSSFAAPFVTAAAVMELTTNAGASPSDVAKAIFANAKDIGKSGPDPVFGAGLVQLSDICQPTETP